MSASDALRLATARVHRELENSEFARRLVDGSVERQSYADYLRAIAVVVANLRTMIRRQGSHELTGLLPTLDDWTNRLDADTRVLVVDDATANEQAQVAALDFVQKIYLHSGHETDWLYGALYVLYGSHRGNLSIADAVSRGLHLPDELGTTYFRATGSRGVMWREFKAMLDLKLVSAQQQHLAESGAADTFRCFEQVFRALAAPGRRGVLASAVNPEAGDHPVPQDDRLAALAAEVGRQCHLDFGYLERRYGSRGEAFARSDGVWMVTLVDMPAAQAEHRVDWLARLLSSRGIPSLCLEHHLEQLHHALSDAGVLDDNKLARLLALSERVGAARRSAVPEERWTAITNLGVPAIDPLGAATLVSAAIDQQSGLAACADSVEEWIKSASTLETSEREELLAILRLVLDR